MNILAADKKPLQQVSQADDDDHNNDGDNDAADDDSDNHDDGCEYNCHTILSKKRLVRWSVGGVGHKAWVSKDQTWEARGPP